MDLTKLNVNILPDGYVVSFSKDGYTIDKLSGSIEVIYEVLQLSDDYYKRTKWFKDNFNVPTPVIRYNLTKVDSDGNIKVISQVEPDKFKRFIEKIKDNSFELIQYELLNE